MLTLSHREGKGGRWASKYDMYSRLALRRTSKCKIGGIWYHFFYSFRAFDYELQETFN
jgi:hypothetical protein